MEEIINYPLYYYCGTKTAYNTLEKQANSLLGLPNKDSERYSNPIIDKDGKYYFIVQPEVSELVDLTKCVEFDKINL